MSKTLPFRVILENNHGNLLPFGYRPEGRTDFWKDPDLHPVRSPWILRIAIGCLN